MQDHRDHEMKNFFKMQNVRALTQDNYQSREEEKKIISRRNTK